METAATTPPFCIFPKRLVQLTILLTILTVIVLVILGPRSPEGRYDDPGIGAEGHVYWEFSKGKANLVIVEREEGQQPFSSSTAFGTYQQTSKGWVFINDHHGLTTNQIAVYWWGIKLGQDQIRWRCLRFWN